MNIFDILGPVMIGPSSSHTAGAVKLGYVARTLLGETPIRAEVFLHGSFADTGKGHGTDCAIIAGILGMREADERIPNSIIVAKEEGLDFRFESIQLVGVHPNTAIIHLESASGKKISMQGSSIGGSRIMLHKIDGADVECSAEYPTLIVYNKDLPGYVAEVAGDLAMKNINIATMRLFRGKRGTEAVMIIESDQAIPQEVIEKIKKKEGIIGVTYLPGI